MSAHFREPKPESRKYEFDPTEGSLSSAASRGFVVTGCAQAVKVALQMLSLVLLSRMLSPEDFGIMAMAAPILAFMGIFQNLGLTQATVQRDAIAHIDVNFLFWINTLASVAVAALVFATSPFAVFFYSETRVGPLIAALALPMLMWGLGAQHNALLNRRMEFGRLALIEVMVGVASLATAIIWAWLSPTYWALWASSLVGSLVYVAMTWSAAAWWPTRPLRSPIGRKMLGFGAGLTGFNLTNFFSRNLDNILIGYHWGNFELGHYDRAYKLLLFPLSQITNPLSQVMVPTLSRLLNEPDRYLTVYFKVFGLLQFFILPLIATAVALSSTVVVFFLGPQWEIAADIFSVLGIAALTQTISNPTGWLFISQGRTKEFAAWGAFSASVTILVFFVTVPYGVMTLAAGYSAISVLTTPILWFYTTRNGPISGRSAIRHIIPLFLGGITSFVLVSALNPIAPDNTVAHLTVSTIVAYLGYAIVLSTNSYGRSLLRDTATFSTRGVSNAWRRINKLT